MRPWTTCAPGDFGLRSIGHINCGCPPGECPGVEYEDGGGLEEHPAQWAGVTREEYLQAILVWSAMGILAEIMLVIGLAALYGCPACGR